MSDQIQEQEYVAVARVEDLPPGEMMEVDIQGEEIALFNLDGGIFAIDDACTHEGGTLSEGPVQGDEVVCPSCGSRFSIVSGQARGLPAMEDVASYRVRITGDDDVEVEV